MGISNDATLEHVLGVLKEFGIPEHQARQEPRLNRLLNSQELADLFRELSHLYGFEFTVHRHETVASLIQAIHVGEETLPAP